MRAPKRAVLSESLQKEQVATPNKNFNLSPNRRVKNNHTYDYENGHDCPDYFYCLPCSFVIKHPN
jgi:hypothetical protein